MGISLLDEKPKMGELQMDWLRSEDLKEEENVTTPATIIAGEGLLHFGVARRLRRTMGTCADYIFPVPPQIFLMPR